MLQPNDINMNDNTRYIILESPTHSWLRVPLFELDELNISEEISPFSYTDGEFVYLEEDMDMGIFLMQLQAIADKPLDWETEIERRDVDDFPHLPNIVPF